MRQLVNRDDFTSDEFTFWISSYLSHDCITMMIELGCFIYNYYDFDDGLEWI